MQIQTMASCKAAIGAYHSTAPYPYSHNSKIQFKNTFYVKIEVIEIYQRISKKNNSQVA
jgi:hypothetical protein